MRTLIVTNRRAFESRVISFLEGDPDIEIVGIASSGREGVRLAKQFLPELVITEFDMQDMTGPALTRALKSDGIPPPVVIIVSTKEGPYYGQLAHQAGADGHLPGTGMGQLLSLVNTLRERHP